MRQVGESKGGDGRPERPFGTEEMRGCWNLNKERLKKKKPKPHASSRLAVAEGSGVRTADSSGPERRYQPAERSAPGGVSTADSGGGGGGPRRMTLHLAREVLSPRSHRSGGPSAPRTAPPAPRLQLSARPPRAPSPPPLPLKNELVSLLLWGWVFFVSFFFSLCCVCFF